MTPIKAEAISIHRLLRALCALAMTILLSGFLGKRDTAESILSRIPVQSGGRVKPFESFAHEALLSVTGKTSLEKKNAAAVVWGWITRPETWNTQSFLPVRNAALRQEFALMVIGGKISPELVLTHAPFQEKVEEALAKEEKKEPLLFLEKKRIELYDQARLFQAIVQGSLPGFFPNPQDPRAGWIPLSGLADPEKRIQLEQSYSPAGLAAVQASLARLVEALREDKTVIARKRSDRSNDEIAAKEFSASLHQLFESRDILLDQTKIKLELFYNQIHPFKWAWIFYLTSALIWFLLRERAPQLFLACFISGFLYHTAGFFLRCYLVGRPPVTNMYESIIWVAWAAVLFSSILGLIYKKTVLSASAAWVAFFTLLIGESFPAVLDPSLAPLVPVLRNNYWLTVHVLTITLSYGAFALACGIAHACLFQFAFQPNKKKAPPPKGGGEEQEQLAQYLYRALQIGVVLLATGTILGGVWANDSWGRFWGWDPKETWALIALFGYLAVLHGRFAGWLGNFGTAFGAVVAFLGVLMAWYGVNFVLAAGFHSYGFGGGGLPYVASAVALDLVLISFLAFRYNHRKLNPALSQKRK